MSCSAPCRQLARVGRHVLKYSSFPHNTTTDHLVEQVQRRKAPDTTFYEDDILLTLSERAVFFS